jgi:outer membrane phospholipase A
MLLTRQTELRAVPLFFTLAILLVIGISSTAHAAATLLPLPREVSAQYPLELTMMYSNDASYPLNVTVPQQITVTYSNGDVTPHPLTLQREPAEPDQLTLQQGQYRAIRFSAPWPASARGTVTIDPVDIDSAPMLITLDRRNPAAFVAAPPVTHASDQLVATRTDTTPVQSVRAASTTQPAAPLTTDAHTSFLGDRLSAFEPIYFSDGQNGANIAKFQISFKYRLVLPNDPRSRSLLSNLYFGYTQTSLWDLSAPSIPFRDTSYQPQLFYYLRDTGWHSRYFTRMGITAGLGHESNGRDGATSRAINTLFVRPTWDFGNLAAYHLTFSPKLYYYLTREGNEDIADYRGYADILVKYGSPNGWQLATTLRKGTKHWYGSVDAQLTYPLAQLTKGILGGYLWLGYFNGYGEDMLDYNQRHHWMARIGYSFTR